MQDFFKIKKEEAGTKLAKKEEIDHEKWSISSLNYTKIKYLHL